MNKDVSHGFQYLNMWSQQALLFGKLGGFGLVKVSVSLWADTERFNPHLLFALCFTVEFEEANV